MADVKTLECWKPRKIETVWDDLLDGVRTREDWDKRRVEVKGRFLALLRDEAKAQRPRELEVEVLEEWKDREGFLIRKIRYNVEADGEKTQAYLAIPAGEKPAAGWPTVLCLHGTTNWGARQTLGLGPERGDPHEKKGYAGADFARNLVRNGFATLSPEHFCCASRCPKEGPFDTAAFYRKHPQWSAIGKSTFENTVALDVLCGMDLVDREKIGVTGHSLGGHNSVFIAAYDERVKCVFVSCGGPTIRANPEPLVWSRDHWYIYIPQIREQLLRGEEVRCDYHEMMSLIAPRPLMDWFTLNDGDSEMQAHRVMMHLKLHELWRLLGLEERHSFLVGGDGHALTDLSRGVTEAWMKRWLVHGGNGRALC